MNDGIEVFVANGGKHFQPDALEFELAGAGIVRAAINCHLVPARDEACRQVFGESFKAAVVRRNTTRSENRDAHKSERGALHQTTKALDASRKFLQLFR